MRNMLLIMCNFLIPLWLHNLLCDVSENIVVSNSKGWAFALVNTNADAICMHYAVHAFMHTMLHYSRSQDTFARYKVFFNSLSKPYWTKLDTKKDITEKYVVKFATTLWLESKMDNQEQLSEYWNAI